MKANGPPSQVCNVDPIESLLDNNVPYQNGAIAWIFRYLQFSCKSARHPGEANSHILYPIASDSTYSSDDHPGDISFIQQLTSPSLRFDNAACISRLVDFLSVAHFFEVGPLQIGISRYLSSACRKFMQLHLLIFSKGPSGSLRFKQLVKVPGLLESTTYALIRAASIVPANSDMWFSTAMVYRTMRLVLESAGGGDQVTQQLLRLSSISAFASAWVRATCELKHPFLDGIFPQSPNWALQSTDCACSACKKRVWRKDLVERTAAEKAAGAVQKFALVNPYDGYKTVFCDYCLHNCGVPWGSGNKPRNPHE